MKQICLFCGSSFGNSPRYRQATIELIDSIVSRGIGVVYGGAQVGLMGVVADEVLARGGKVIGVLPQSLRTKEIAHPELTELHFVESMHERKQKMFDLSDAFIALPGGLGTLDEIFEIYTWGQLGMHQKPAGFLNVDGFYDLLIRHLDQLVSEGFVLPECRKMVLVEKSSEALLQGFETYLPPDVQRWIGRHQT